MKFKELVKKLSDQRGDAEQLEHVMKEAWTTGKVSALDNRVSFEDIREAIAVPQALITLPKVIVEVAREAAEPNLVLSSLLDRIQYQPGMQIITGATGAVTAEDLAEGQEYPEMQLNRGGSSAIAAVGKCGIAFKITDEMVRYGQLDLINLHIRAAGRALARLKEEKVADYLIGMGVTIFDNVNPTDSFLGNTSGRDEYGNPNGTITHDDLFELFVAVIDRGFLPNLMIMHPLTWLMFMKDTQLRAFAMSAGNQVWWGGYNGNPQNKGSWGTGKTNGPSEGQATNPSTSTGQMNHVNQMSQSAVMPSYFLPFSVSIITSPHIWFDRKSRVSDIIVADRNELGVLIVDQEVTMEEWRDPRVDITKMKFLERYDIHIYHRGLGIAVARNIKIDTSKISTPAQPQIDVSTLSPIPTTTGVL